MIPPPQSYLIINDNLSSCQKAHAAICESLIWRQAENCIQNFDYISIFVLKKVMWMPKLNTQENHEIK